MIRWPDLSKYGASAVIFHGRHAVRIEKPEPAIAEALGGEIHDNGLIILPYGTRLNSRMLSAAFPSFSTADVKEISSLDEVDDSARPYVVDMPFGTNFMAGIPSFEAARAMAESLPAQSIVRLEIKRGTGPNLDSAVHTLYAAFVANGDGSAVFVQKTFPESKEPLGAEEILRLADEERARWAPVPETSEAPQIDEENPQRDTVRADETPPAPAIETPDASDNAAEKKTDGKKSRRIEDVGAKIGGARKDYSKNAMRYEDAMSMTDAEREKLITIQNIWPFNIRDALDSGMEPGVVRYILDARRGLSSYSEYKKSLERRSYRIFVEANAEKNIYKWYINLAGALRECMVNVKTRDDLSQAIAKFHRMPDVVAAQKESNDYALGCFLRTWKWLEDTMTTQLDYQGRVVGEYVRRPNGWGGIHSMFNSPDNFDYAVRRLLPQRSRSINTDDAEQKEDEERKFARPHLDNLVDDFLDGVDHDPQELIDRFGFKGVEFGNWMPQDERQRVVNHAISSFAFLADVLGIPENQISLGGELSLAFGARGKGGKHAPMAHYESTRRVMNLTRLSGAGSLAHEYGHALDNFLGNESPWNGFISDKAGNRVIDAVKFERRTDRAIDDFMMETRRVSERHSRWAESWASSILGKTDMKGGYETPGGLTQHTRPSGQELVDDIVISSIMEQVPDITIEHIVAAKAARDKEDKNAQLVPFLFDVLKASGFQPNVVLSDNNKAIDVTVSRFNQYGIKLRDFRKAGGKSEHWQLQANLRKSVRCAVDLIGAMNPRIRDEMGVANMHSVETRFFADAKKIDEKRYKPYWSTNTELFARAFEQFVFYEAIKLDKRVDYLVHSVESPQNDNTAAYPCERDRLAFHDSLKTYFLPYLHKVMDINNENHPQPAM